MANSTKPKLTFGQVTEILAKNAEINQAVDTRSKVSAPKNSGLRKTKS